MNTTQKASVLKMALSEMRMRKTNSSLVFVCLAVAVMVAVATVVLFGAYDRSEETYATLKHAEVKVQLDSLWDNFRKITKSLGFNVLILPKDQNLSDFYSKDFASKYMPESYGQTLLQSGIISVEHLDPTLLVKTLWPEQRRTIIACGTHGELARGAQSAARAPIVQAVEPGALVAGYDLAEGCNLRPGKRIVFMGRSFTVASCRPKQGNRDDITLWFDLAEAQSLFNKPGLINAICALECRCAADKTLPNIAKIRSDMERILPNTQVVEFMSEVLTRAEVRYEEERMARETLDREITARTLLRSQRIRFGSFILVLVLAASAIGAGLLLHANAVERRHEVGVLRALGASRTSVMALFFCKAIVCGASAAFCGILAGWGIGATVAIAAFGPTAAHGEFNAPLFAAIGLITLAAGAGAAWPAAFSASLVDPAYVMGEV
jgi:cell division protein FtsX